MAFIGIAAKFSYILVLKDAGNYAIAKMFNYTYLSQFLWVLGNEVFSISAGTLLLVASKFMTTDLKIEKIFKWISFFVIAMGFYFLGWVFFNPFYSGALEIVMAIVFSVVFTVIYFPFLMYLNKEINTTKQLKQSFLVLLSDIRNVYYKSTLKTAMSKDLEDDAYQEELKNQSRTLQNRLYEEAKELIN